MRMERVLAGLLVLSLAACGKPETAPPPRRAPPPERRTPPARETPPPETPPDAPPGVETPDHFDEKGDASFYGAEFAGRPTASGEIFDPAKHTAAHRTLPFGTELVVTNLDNGRSVRVKVNDRGPFVKNRILDCSAACADALGYAAQGTARVGLTILKRGDGARVAPPAPRAPPAVAPPPARPDEDDADLNPGAFAIQVGAFSSKAAAQAAAAKYRAQGYTVYFREAGAIVRVRLGPYKDERKARADLAKLGEGLVVREDNP